MSVMRSGAAWESWSTVKVFDPPHPTISNQKRASRHFNPGFQYPRS
jgi:hypothetical protein